VRVEQQAIEAKKGIWRMSRWHVLSPEQLDKSLLGQFRLVRGQITALDKSGWQFSMGKLWFSVPKKYRTFFRNSHKAKEGESALVRGVVRMSKKGKWFLSVHSPSDVRHLRKHLH